MESLQRANKKATARMLYKAVAFDPQLRGLLWLTACQLAKQRLDGVELL